MRQRFICRGLFIPLLLVIGLLSSCVQEHIGGEKPNEKEPTVTFSLKVPKAATPAATRSLTVAEESGIETIDVMVFDRVKGYKNTRIGKQIGGPTPKGDDIQIDFEVTLPKGDFDLVVITNGRTIINQAKTDNILVENVARDIALASLIKSQNKEDKWTDVDIPMWGYRYDSTIDENTDFTGKNAIAMVRMLAKIEVVLTKEAAGLEGNNENFKIEELYLYNYNTKGRLVPNIPVDSWDGTTNIAKDPVVPDNAKVEKGKSLKYTKADDPSGEFFTLSSVTNTIYTFESKNGTKESHLDNICLVIGGTYKDTKRGYYRVDFVDRKDNNKLLDLLRNHRYNFIISAITGEGLDTPDDAYKAGPMNIEANVLHWNTADMGEVVFDSQNFLAINPAEIEHSCEAVAEQKISVKTDYLMEKLNFSLSASATKPDEALSESWLTLSPTAPEKATEIGGYPAKEYTLSYSADENPTGAARTAYIHVEVGRLKNVVKITQFEDVGVGLSFQVLNENGRWMQTENMQFMQQMEGANLEPKSFRVVWSPSKTDVELSIMGATEEYRDIVWDNSYYELIDEIITDKTGIREYTIKPVAIDDYVKGSFIGADLNIGAKMNIGGDEAKATLHIEQIVQDIYIEPTLLTMDGKETHYVTVKSNVPWKLYANKNYSGNLGTKRDVSVVDVVNEVGVDTMDGETAGEEIEVYKEGAANLPDGTRVAVTTVDDMFAVAKPEIFTGNLGLRAQSIEDPDAVFYSREIPCASGISQSGREANCYVLDPSSYVGLLIPVQAANGVFEQEEIRAGKANLNDGRVTLTKKIDKETEFGAKLVWADVATDDGIGVGEDGLIRAVVHVGYGDKGYILVLPGDKKTQEGNALVAVTESRGAEEGEGDILWSWHIWVTDGMKYSDGLMGGVIVGGHNGTGKDHAGRVRNGTTAWLDRNIGALRNGYTVADPTIPETDTEELILSRGLFYQWGRKDPTPTTITADEDGRIDKKLYNLKGEIIPGYGYGSIPYSKERFTIEESIRFPDTFAEPNDWTTEQNDYLWGQDSNKSIFDPCPAGWRLPETYSWENSFGEYENLGRIYMGMAYRGGYYTTPGARVRNGVTDTRRNGHYWTRSAMSNDHLGSIQLAVLSYDVYPMVGGNRTYGYSVRCMAE